jgi:cbb3-type cytochrome oxidase maturation protein
MDILFLLVPVSVMLALAVLALLGWAVWAGQFEDMEKEGQRILRDEDTGASTPGGASKSVAPGLIHINTDAAHKGDTELTQATQDFQ